MFKELKLESGRSSLSAVQYALLFHEDRDWLTLCVKIQSPVSEWVVLPSIISNQLVEFYFTDRPQVLFFFPSSSNVFTRGCVDF